jgi:HD-GYP domain-containing protein (c-di-GMP phosphodiesterase class II)
VAPVADAGTIVEAAPAGEVEPAFEADPVPDPAASEPELEPAVVPEPDPDPEEPAPPATQPVPEPAAQEPPQPPAAAVPRADPEPQEMPTDEPHSSPDADSPDAEPAATEPVAAEQASVEPVAPAAAPLPPAAPPPPPVAPPPVAPPPRAEPTVAAPRSGSGPGRPEAPAAPIAARQRRAGELVEPSPPPSMSREEAEAIARTAYNEALQAVGHFFQAGRDAAEGKPQVLPINEIQSAASKLVSGMADPHVGDALVAFAVGAYPDEDRFIVPHSVNVATLSQRVGRHLQLEDIELLTLAVAGLVHDVGTVRIPKEVFYKDDSLTNEEWEMMRQRPRFGSEIISALGPRYRAVAEIAHQVHERLDGNGYPRRLTVDSIALEASILGAVDIFEAFIHPRPYKKTVPAAAMYGVDNLMRMSHQFGDGVLKALVRSVGLFPVGTFVRLNSGEIARVLRGRSANPMRPEVEVVLDTQKRRLSKPRFIDLMSSPHLYVFKPLSPEEMIEFEI